MPKCIRCNEMFPPHFCVSLEIKTKDSDAVQCVYCSEGIESITVDKGDGNILTYSKKQCIKDYKEFLNKLKSKKNIAKAFVKGEISDKSGIILGK